MYLQAGLGVPVPETNLEQGVEVDLPDTPEDLAEREGIHERIQAELWKGRYRRVTPGGGDVGTPSSMEQGSGSNHGGQRYDIWRFEAREMEERRDL